MTTKTKRPAVKLRPVCAWLLAVPFAAYMALGLHASAMQTHTMTMGASPFAEFVGTTAKLCDAGTVPSGSCCQQHSCTDISAFGPPVPNSRVQLPNPAPVAVARFFLPITAKAPSLTGSHAAAPWLIARPVYLTTLRLRL